MSKDKKTAPSLEPVKSLVQRYRANSDNHDIQCCVLLGFWCAAQNRKIRPKLVKTELADVTNTIMSRAEDNSDIQETGLAIFAELFQDAPFCETLVRTTSTCTRIVVAQHRHSSNQRINDLYNKCAKRLSSCAFITNATLAHDTCTILASGLEFFPHDARLVKNVSASLVRNVQAQCFVDIRFFMEAIKAHTGNVQVLQACLEGIVHVDRQKDEDIAVGVGLDQLVLQTIPKSSNPDVIKYCLQVIRDRDWEEYPKLAKKFAPLAESVLHQNALPPDTHNMAWDALDTLCKQNADVSKLVVETLNIAKTATRALDKNTAHYWRVLQFIWHCAESSSDPTLVVTLDVLREIKAILCTNDRNPKLQENIVSLLEFMARSPPILPLLVLQGFISVLDRTGNSKFANPETKEMAKVTVSLLRSQSKGKSAKTTTTSSATAKPSTTASNKAKPSTTASNKAKPSTTASTKATPSPTKSTATKSPTKKPSTSVTSKSNAPKPSTTNTKPGPAKAIAPKSPTKSIVPKTSTATATEATGVQSSDVSRSKATKRPALVQPSTSKNPSSKRPKLLKTSPARPSTSKSPTSKKPKLSESSPAQASASKSSTPASTVKSSSANGIYTKLDQILKQAERVLMPKPHATPPSAGKQKATSSTQQPLRKTGTTLTPKAPLGSKSTPKNKPAKASVRGQGTPKSTTQATPGSVKNKGLSTPKTKQDQLTPWTQIAKTTVKKKRVQVSFYVDGPMGQHSYKGWFHGIIKDYKKSSTDGTTHRVQFLCRNNPDLRQNLEVWCGLTEAAHGTKWKLK